MSRSARAMPWQTAAWCALDLELTGLDPQRDEIIAVGAVPIEDGRVLLGKALYTLVRSTKPSAHGAVLTHKLRLADLAEAPTVDEAIDLVLEMIADRVPVFHTAAVERAFLGPHLARRHLQLPAAADTEALGRAWLCERDGTAPPRLSLRRLTAVLGLPEESPHHALGDALTTAKVFIVLASRLEAIRPQTVTSLVNVPGRSRGARRFGPVS
jgi:DNA polymerase-3 subunit epsilon